MALKIKGLRSRGRRTGASRPVTKSDVKQILLSRQEIKQFTSSSVGGTPFTTAGVVLQLDTIGQGDDINQRSGDTVTLKSVRFQLTSFEPTANTSSTWRLIIFTDSMANGALPSVTDVLDSSAFTAPYNGVNLQRSRFHILHDKTHVMVGGNPNQEVTDIVYKSMNTRRFFNTSTATSTNIGKNALFALIISSNATTSVYTRQWAVRYTDS